jgi:carbamoyl-phosphate synthase large subunit
MSVRNVLVFPAGTEIGLEILSALKDCKEVRLFGASQDVSNHGPFAFAEYYVLPKIKDENWLPTLVKLCRQLHIDYIFPAYDDAIVALAQHRHQLPAAVIAPSRETCEITRSKSQTYRKMLGIVAVPRLYASAEDVDRYPVFVKPDRGQGSFATYLAQSKTELEHALRAVPEAVISEYLPGEEYTVDCFSDRDKGVLFARARRRRRTRNGISVNTRTEEVDGIDQTARAIGAVLQLHGAWFFQLKRSERGVLTLLEVAPRIAGAMAIHRVIGVNFPLLSIFEYERRPLSIMTNQCEVELDRALLNRYKHSISFSQVYIDFDDTLVSAGRVNTDITTLIFQCINSGIPVKLITRHAGNLDRVLAQYRLCGLFDEVIHIQNGRPKSEFINPAGAIFVDDSFSERSDVAHHCGIPTFDSSMVEMLVHSSCLQRKHANDKHG